MTAPRIEPVGIDTLTASQQAILDRIPGNGLKGEHAPVNVLGTLLRAPTTLTEFLDWWVAGKQRMRLSVREQELVILRMGVLYGSEYVWRHHVVVGREFGVDDRELDALREGCFEVFDEPRERAYLKLTDELVERRDVDDATWERVRDVLDEEQVLELIGLVSQYVLFALTNKVFRVALEPSMLPVPAIASR